MEPTSEGQNIAQTLKLAAGVRVGLALLSERLLTLVGIAANLGVFVLVVLDPQWPKVAAAALFAVAVHCLVHGGSWWRRNGE